MPAAVPLPLAQVLPLAQSLAAREAHWPEDVDDLIQIGLFAYHRATTRHRRDKIPVPRPRALAKTVLLRAMRGYANNPKRRERDKFLRIERIRGRYRAASVQVVVDQKKPHWPLPSVGLDGACESQHLDFLELDAYFALLERSCGRTARSVAENLLSPQDPAVCEHILEYAHRRRKPHERGAKKRIRITRRCIREGLGMSRSEWFRTLRQIRSFTRDWLARSAIL